jgi:hypothetical protein
MNNPDARRQLKSMLEYQMRERAYGGGEKYKPTNSRFRPNLYNGVR